MKRIKVGEKDYHVVNDINNRIQTCKKVLDRSIPVIKALIGRFDTEALSDIITGTNNTRNELEKAMLSDIEKLSSVIMKDEFKNKLKNALSSYDETAKAMIAAVNSISDIIPTQNWCIEKDSALIRDYDSLIEEATGVYITSEKGIVLYERLKALTGELNDINKQMKAYNVTAVQHPPLQRGLIWLDAKNEYILNGVLTANLVKEVYK